MLHNNAAQQRPSEKPALAPKSSHITSRAQGQADIKIPTRKHPRSRLGDTNAASLPDGNMDTTHIIHIHGRHSPPPQLGLTTHAAQHTQQHSHGPAGIQQNSKLSPWFAQHHPLREGHEQACLVLGPEQGTEHGMLPLHVTQELQQKPVPSQHKEKSAELQQITWTHHHNTALQTPGNTQATATAQYTHSTLLKSSNRPMAATRRRQGQQLYAWHGTPSRRLRAAPPFPLTPAGEAIQPQPPALPPEAWPYKCNTNKAKQSKRDKVFLSTTHS